MSDTSCIIFICEPGELEIKSVLLSYSLRKHDIPERRVIANIPKHLEKFIKPETLEVFKQLRVEVRHFENNSLSGLNNKNIPGDGMSNKFSALRNLNPETNYLFLDSDILCINDLSHLFHGETIKAKPADVILKTDWQRIYEIASLAYPKETISCTVDNNPSPPYFNTGVLYLPGRIIRNLTEHWEKYFMLFTKQEILLKKIFTPFHRDQVAFALAVVELDLSLNQLSELDNFPIRRRDETDYRTIRLVHYHDFKTILVNNMLFDYFRLFTCCFSTASAIVEGTKPWSTIFVYPVFILRLVYKIQHRLMPYYQWIKKRVRKLL